MNDSNEGATNASAHDQGLTRRRFVAGATAGAGLAATGMLAWAGPAEASHRRPKFFSWDVLDNDFSNAPAEVIANPGGFSSAQSGDISNLWGKLTITGHGTFAAPAIGRTSRRVTGGGDWETFDNNGVSTGTGRYKVTSVVSWVEAPGTLLGTNIVDNNGDAADSQAGLATFTVRYDDRSIGVLTVSCRFPTTPPEVAIQVQEGITATKGYVHYWYRDDPQPGVNGDRTVFHVTDRL